MEYLVNPPLSGRGLLNELHEGVRASIYPRDFHHHLLSGLRALVGCDGAAYRPGQRWTQSSAFYLDEDTRFTDGYVRNADVYRSDVTQWCDLSKGARAFIDTEIYSTSERRKKALYADVVEACGVRSIMGCPLTIQRETIGLVLLYRTGRARPFKADQAMSLDPLLPGLAMAELALSRPSPEARVRAMVARLPSRHRALLDELLTGKSEREIAETLALSNRTVHKYTEQIFRVFGIKSRAALMAHFVNRRVFNPGEM